MANGNFDTGMNLDILSNKSKLFCEKLRSYADCARKYTGQNLNDLYKKDIQELQSKEFKDFYNELKKCLRLTVVTQEQKAVRRLYKKWIEYKPSSINSVTIVENINDGLNKLKEFKKWIDENVKSNLHDSVRIPEIKNTLDKLLNSSNLNVGIEYIKEFLNSVETAKTSVEKNVETLYDVHAKKAIERRKQEKRSSKVLLAVRSIRVNLKDMIQNNTWKQLQQNINAVKEEFLSLSKSNKEYKDVFNDISKEFAKTEKKVEETYKYLDKEEKKQRKKKK